LKEGAVEETQSGLRAYHYSSFSSDLPSQTLEEGKGCESICKREFLVLDSAATEEASKIIDALLRIGKPISGLDVLISGIAVANAADEIVTSDKDFQTIEKVANIKVTMI
jgi:predicted nucleic acid-binding protein